MNQLDVERNAVERLEDGVANLRALRSWQRTTDEIQRAPLDRLTLFRKVDQARARGDEPVLDDLLAEIKRLDSRVEDLTQRNLQLENERGLDGLTGVANRARLDNVLRQEWRRCARVDTSLALIFVDLDEFKDVNDSHGHRAGDALLVGVGQQLQRVMRRAGDVVGRYGGDEFVIVLPTTDLEEAAGIAQRVQDSLTKMEVQFGKIVLRARASIGVGAVNPFGAGSSIEGLIDRCDQAVYAAKNLGRGRIVAAVERDGQIAFAHVQPHKEEEPQQTVQPSRSARR